ncbi:UNVERIFIED_CONTAM: Pentatricopeptide repeat-containing protein [Sesamum radiatum]|uniref:Pentatricopeptide repeat-containing protein n=1 Tax=Sesamum radiatum TaxID=300843 RepID=A0AAW2QH17_SESRA
MFVQFQPSDTTNSLRILSSINPASPIVGLSVTPPVKKSNDQIKQKKQENQVLECLGHGHMSKKNGLERAPGGRVERKYSFSGRFGTQGGGFNGRGRVLEKEDVTMDGFLVSPDSRVQKNGCFEVNLRSASGVNGEAEEFCTGSSLAEGGGNGVYRKKKRKKNGYVRKLGGCVENHGKNRGDVRSGSLVEEMKTKCSTKWARYGGCIPAMLEALETVNDLDEALKPWERTLTNKERSILLKEQLEWERALEIFEWFKMKGCYEVNVIHYNIMFRILGRARQWCVVEKLWGEMWKRGIKPINSTYGTLIDVYCKGGFRDTGIKWLELMNESGMEPDEVTTGIVVQMYKKAGDFKRAEEFFKKWSWSNSVVDERGSAMARSKADVSGDSSANVCLSTYTYNTLIDTYGKAGKLQKASETFERMLQKGILPTTVTFNTMIHMFGNNGLLDEVASLMERMEKAKCSPDTRTFNILISVHAKYNYIELAARYLTKMKEASLEPDAVSYRTLLYAFSIRHMVAEAEKLISEMDERGMEIDEFTQSSLTRMYIESGMLEKSWSWFQRFHLGGNMTSECYSANIDAFGERGYILEAQKVFDCCQQVKKITILEFNVMIKAYGISKKFEQACCLFDSMEEHGLIADRCGYNSLVQMLASADLPQKATFYLRKMQEVGLVIDCVPYCAVISSYAKLGQMDMAVGLYKEMIGHGVKPDVIVYGVLINAFANTGSVNEAIYYVDAMRNLGLPMNGVIYERTRTYERLVELQSRAGLYASDGRYKDAVATFDEMLKSLIQPDDSTFKSLGIILLKCGVPKNAIEKLELIRKEDTERGLQAWTSTLSSVVDMDDDVTDDDV